MTSTNENSAEREDPYYRFKLRAVELNDGFDDGRLVGNITKATKGMREYVVFSYRWFHDRKARVNFSKSFRCEDYGGEEGALRAAVEEQKKFCHTYNLRQNDYRIDDDVVTMKLCLQTANVPSESYIKFDRADLELVKQKLWYHDQARGAVFIDKGRDGKRIPMAAYIHYNGNIPWHAKKTFIYVDHDWKNNRRSNLKPRVNIDLSDEMIELYRDLRRGRHVGIIGKNETKHQRYRLQWTAKGVRHRQYFSYRKQKPRDAQLEARAYLLDYVARQLDEVDSEESDDDVPRYSNGDLVEREISELNALNTRFLMN